MRNNGNAKMTKAKKLWALIVSGIIAIALGVTCGVCFGTGNGSVGTTNGVESGGVSHSVTQPTASTAVNDYTAAGAIKNGEVLSMAYSGKVYAIKLPKGIFTLEVWGAQGGHDSRYSTQLAGRGGYSKGKLTLSEPLTLYVYVGQQGGNTAPTSSSWGSTGGGGGTDIALWGTAGSTTWDNTNHFNSRILVAGGGA